MDQADGSARGQVIQGGQVEGQVKGHQVEGRVPVRYRRLRGAAMTPRYMSEHAAGADLASAADGALLLAPGARLAVPTGLALEIPAGYEGQVRPRSGLALRAGVTVVNSPGTIDADYRGEVMVLLVNLGPVEYTINPGDRIAQLVIAPVTRGEFEETTELSTSDRGDGGFGHSG
jgi:dUTP pyrophosphatase